MVAVPVESSDDERDAGGDAATGYDDARWGTQYAEGGVKAGGGADAAALGAARARAKERFDAGDFEAAAEVYTEALDGAARAAVGSHAAQLYLNRALCSLRLGAPDAALSDVDLAAAALGAAERTTGLPAGGSEASARRLEAKCEYTAARAHLLRAEQGEAGAATKAIDAARAGLRVRSGDSALVAALGEGLALLGSPVLASHFAALIEDAQAMRAGALSARDGKCIKPVPQDIRLSSRELCDGLEKFILGREAEVRDLLAAGWASGGEYPSRRLKFVLYGLRSAAYRRSPPAPVGCGRVRSRIEQAVADAKAAVAHSPEMSRRAWGEEFAALSAPQRDPVTGMLPSAKERKMEAKRSLARRFMDEDENAGRAIVKYVDEARPHLALIPRADGGGGILDACVDAEHLAVTSAGAGVTDGCVNVPRKTWPRAYALLGDANAGTKDWPQAALYFRRAFEADPSCEEYIEELRQACRWLPTKQAEALMSQGADKFEVLLVEDKLMTGPGYLRPREEYANYYRWMRERIYEHYPSLPEPVMQKLLKHDAYELDLLLSFPKAIKGQTDEYLEVYRKDGGEYLESYQTPMLTWDEVKAMKGPGMAGLQDTSNVGPGQDALPAGTYGYEAAEKDTDHSALPSRGDGGLTAAERLGAPAPTQLPPDRKRDVDQIMWGAGRLRKEIEASSAGAAPLGSRQAVILRERNEKLEAMHSGGKAALLEDAFGADASLAAARKADATAAAAARRAEILAAADDAAAAAAATLSSSTFSTTGDLDEMD
eukprot:PRCOL_00005703-RA